MISGPFGPWGSTPSEAALANRLQELVVLVEQLIRRVEALERKS